MMEEQNSLRFLEHVFSSLNEPRILSIDLETLIDSPDDFLNGERIIAVSLSYGHFPFSTEVYIAKDDTEYSEKEILKRLDRFLGEYRPNVIIGYNHTGYDIPLIQSKTRTYPYADQLWNFKYYCGTAIVTDMMYVIAEDLESVEDFRIRKLRDVVSHPRYADLNLRRTKEIVNINGMNVGQAIRHLWKNERDKFLEYCQGDTEDVLSIFYHIFH